MSQIEVNEKPRYDEGPRDWQKCFVLSRIFSFYHNWGKENRELHQGIRHTEVRYIQVQLGSGKQQLNNSNLCIEVPTTEYYCAIYRSFQYIFCV